MPADLAVHVIVDNSSTHKAPTIQRWLVRHPRFSLHFTPTYTSWITNWNDDPKPFVWHKTADEVLDSLAAYCKRISDSGH